MAINIYTKPSADSVLSQNATFENPFSLSFDGKLGGIKEVKLYLRNDNPLYYYIDLELSLEDEENVSITNNPDSGFTWKLSYGDTKPTENEWKHITPANTLTNIPNLGTDSASDTSTYLPFWVQISVGGNIDVQIFTGVQFIVSGQEALV